MATRRTRLRDRNFDIDRYINPFIPSNQASKLPRPISHFLGYRTTPSKDVGNIFLCFWSCLGGFLSIILMEAVFMIPAIRGLNPPLMIASFGAAAILQYNTIASPLAQPRNAIVGELLATALGIAITKLFLLLPHSPLDSIPSSPSSLSSPTTSTPNLTFENLRFLAGALNVGLSSALMTVTKTVYPPAGATALLAAIDPRCTELGWWLLPLAMLSTAVNLVVGCGVNNLQRRWPVWWWCEGEVGRKKTTTPDSRGGNGARADGPGEVVVVQGVEVDTHQADDEVDLGVMSGEKRASEASTVTLGFKQSGTCDAAQEKERSDQEEEERQGAEGDGPDAKAPTELAVRIKGDGIVLPEDFEITERESEVLGEIRRRMRIMQHVTTAEVTKGSDDNV